MKHTLVAASLIDERKEELLTTASNYNNVYPHADTHKPTMMAYITATPQDFGERNLWPLFTGFKDIVDFDNVVKGTYLPGSHVNALKGDDEVFLPSSEQQLFEAAFQDFNFHGGEGNDIVHGRGLDDSIYGDQGNDLLSGGDANDQIYGGTGNDQLYGGNGIDILVGEDGNDVIFGGAGFDDIWGGKGDDTISGDAGNDLISGHEGNDLISGGAGNDDLSGGAGDDLLKGGDGYDDLQGFEGNDILFGGNSYDRLDGGEDKDSLTGGGGADWFAFEANDGAANLLTCDVIEDFEDGVDKIQVYDDFGVDLDFSELKIENIGQDCVISVAETQQYVCIVKNAAGLITQEDLY